MTLLLKWCLVLLAVCLLISCAADDGSGGGDQADDDVLDDDSIDDDTAALNDDTGDDDTAIDDDLIDDDITDNDSVDDDSVDDDTTDDDSVDDDSADDDTGDDDTSDDDVTPHPDFFVGFSQGDGKAVRVPLVAEMGANWFRGWIQWRQVEPEITQPELTVEQVRANPQMVHDYIDEHDWSAPDALLTACQENEIENVILVVGVGFDWVLPQYNGEPANPDNLGKENYLGHYYRHIRAAVERYDGDGVYDAPGDLVVHFWEPEAELNEAFLTAVLGWRGPPYEQALFSAWHDFDFLTDIIRLGNEAAREEDEQAVTIMPFHTDIHENFGRFFNYPPWFEAVEAWQEYVDIIGVDAYPNYYWPTPVHGDVLYDRIMRVRGIAPGKPIMVIETGYPSGPAEIGFNEELQVHFIDQAIESARSAGAMGYMHFTIKTGEQHGVVISPEDIDNLYMLGEAFEQGNVLRLLFFALLNLDYLRDHFADVLQAVEPYWGQFRHDGGKKPSWDLLHEKVLLYPGNKIPIARHTP